MSDHTSINPVNHKATRLFIILGGIFIANAIIAEFIGVKIFSLEKLLGFMPVNWTIFGQKGLSFSLTAGVLLWPIVFVLTDIINEYFGVKGVRFLSLLAVGLIAYAYFMIFLGIKTPPADFWITSKQQTYGIDNFNDAFGAVYSQGLRIIIGSLVAFMVGQLVDVLIFHRIKAITGEKYIWARATGSTLVSQLIDSYVVLFVAFYGAEGWTPMLIISVGVVNYIYKFIMAIILTPLIYWMHNIIEKFLGEELAESLRQRAMLDT